MKQELMQTERVIEIGQFLKSKGFKHKTIDIYCSTIKKVTDAIGINFDEKELEDSFMGLDLSPRTYNLRRAIMNFYTKKYLNYLLTFTKAKVDASLPTYVSQEEFNRFLSTIPNVRHRIGFGLMYYSGLRVYEVCRVKKHDLYFDTLTMYVKEGKGGKDRQTILPKEFAMELKGYVSSMGENEFYLFRTYRGHISERSFQERLKKAIYDAKLTKRFSCHDFRHSFAINLLNKGVDIEIVRKLLGHSCLKTTQIYLQCRTTNLTEIATRLEGNITQCIIQ